MRACIPGLVALVFAGSARGEVSAPDATDAHIVDALGTGDRSAVDLSNAYWRDIAGFEGAVVDRYAACRAAVFAEREAARAADRAEDVARDTPSTVRVAPPPGSPPGSYGMIRAGRRYAPPDTTHCDAARREALDAWHAERDPTLEDAVHARFERLLGSDDRRSAAPPCRAARIWASAHDLSWRMRRDDIDASRALDLYARFGQHCADRPDAMAVLSDRADLLLAGDQPAAAAELFEQLLTRAPDLEQKRSAARGASRAHIQLAAAALSASNACVRPPDPPATRVRDPRPPSPLIWMTAIIERDHRLAADDDDDLFDVLYDEARLYYEGCFFQQSEDRLRAVIEAHPENRRAAFAFNSLMAGYARSGNVRGIERLAERFPELMRHLRAPGFSPLH